MIHSKGQISRMKIEINDAIRWIETGHDRNAIVSLKRALEHLIPEPVESMQQQFSAILVALDKTAKPGDRPYSE